MFSWSSSWSANSFGAFSPSATAVVRMLYFATFLPSSSIWNLAPMARSSLILTGAFSIPRTKTIGNWSPLLAWIVMILTAGSSVVSLSGYLSFNSLSSIILPSATRCLRNSASPPTPSLCVVASFWSASCSCLNTAIGRVSPLGTEFAMIASETVSAPSWPIALHASAPRSSSIVLFMKRVNIDMKDSCSQSWRSSSNFVESRQSLLTRVAIWPGVKRGKNPDRRKQFTFCW